MTRGTYRISDVVLASDIPMPELPEIDGEPQWAFRVAGRAPTTGRPTWFHRWRNPGERPSLSFGRCAGAYLLRFHGRADYAIDLRRRVIAGARRGTTTITTLRHLLIDQVMPLLLSRDRLVLHASAVATPRGAAAFLGFTGSGKSTLAAALAARGFPILTDDCLVVDRSARGFQARPFYPGARLWPDSVRAVGGSLRSLRPVGEYTRKRRLDGRHLACETAALPLGRVFVLEPPARHDPRRPVACTPIRGADALVALLACTFQLDIQDHAAVRRIFDVQSALIGAVPLQRLSYPWDLRRLAATCEAIERELLTPR